jgi:Protein of unknown function (DUF5674)
MIHLLRQPATSQQFDEMLEVLDLYIKLAVDIEQGILAGGGELHADCEKVLLESGSRPRNIWGASWIPSTRTILYESVINIRSRQNNRSMEVLDPVIRAKIAEVVYLLLGGV